MFLFVLFLSFCCLENLCASRDENVFPRAGYKKDVAPEERSVGVLNCRGEEGRRKKCKDESGGKVRKLLEAKSE